jgi:hypothetical protein
MCPKIRYDRESEKFCKIFLKLKRAQVCGDRCMATYASAHLSPVPHPATPCLQFAFRLMVHTTHTYTYLQGSAEPGVTLTLASFKTKFCTGIVGILFKRINILSLS